MLDDTPEGRWFVSSGNRDAQLKLFCFHFAGGSAAIFRQWQVHLPPSVEVVSVQLPGRGNRSSEPPFTRMRSLIGVLTTRIAAQLDRPYALFGHSMGALVAFELAHALAAQSQPNPIWMGLAGRGAAHLPDPGPMLYAASEAELTEDLGRLGGTDSRLLADPVWRADFLPLLRADFAVCETYAFVSRPLLACPVTAYGGSCDRDWPEPHLALWRQHTSGPCDVRMIDGDHFFLLGNRQAVLDDVGRQLVRHLPSAAS